MTETPDDINREARRISLDFHTRDEMYDAVAASLRAELLATSRRVEAETIERCAKHTLVSDLNNVGMSAPWTIRVAKELHDLPRKYGDAS